MRGVWAAAGPGANAGGGLSGVFVGEEPLVVAAGSGPTSSQSAGVNGGAGYPGGAGGADGAGGASFPSTGVTASAVTPSLRLEYTDDDAPVLSLDQPAELNPVSIEGVAGTEGGDGGGVSGRAGGGRAGVHGKRRPRRRRPLRDRAPGARRRPLDGAGGAVRHRRHKGAGNPVTFAVDHRGPRLEFTSPGPFTNQAETAIEGIAGSEPGDLAEVTVTVTGPVGYRATVPATLRGTAFSAALPQALADGAYKAVARQEDRHRHVGTATLTFVVDTIAPVLTLSGPEGDVTSPVTLAGTASEAGDVTVSVGPRTVTVPVRDGAYTTTLNLPDGTYTATARFADAAGNEAVAARTLRVATPNAPLEATRPVIVAPVVVAPKPSVRITRAKRRHRGGGHRDGHRGRGRGQEARHARAWSVVGDAQAAAREAGDGDGLLRRCDRAEDRHVTHQSRGAFGASGTGPRVRGAAQSAAFASTRLISGWW